MRGVGRRELEVCLAWRKPLPPACPSPQVDGPRVSFSIELTTPACPIKDEFERQAREYVGSLAWVEEVEVRMTAQPAKPAVAAQVNNHSPSPVNHGVVVGTGQGT